MFRLRFDHLQAISQHKKYYNFMLTYVQYVIGSQYKNVYKYKNVKKERIELQ
jgi:hypothetical protein